MAKKDEDSAIGKSAEEVLTPPPVTKILYGKTEIEILPLSVRGVIKISKFVTRHIARIVTDGDVQQFLKLPNINDREMLLVFITELFEGLEEDEVYEVLGAITRKDRKFLEEGFSTVALMRVISAFILTEDFKGIFLEGKTLFSAIQGQNQGAKGQTRS